MKKLKNLALPKIETESQLRELIFFIGFSMLFFGLLSLFPSKIGIALSLCGAFLLFVSFYKFTGGAK